MSMIDREFPCWRYRAGEAKLFQTPEALAEAGGVWYDSPAKVGTVAEAAPVVPSESGGIDFSGLSIESLREVAAQNGIAVDKRWKEKRILDEINAAIAAAQAKGE
jgi:hypothetical protein